MRNRLKQSEVVDIEEELNYCDKITSLAFILLSHSLKHLYLMKQWDHPYTTTLMVKIAIMIPYKVSTDA